MRSAAVSSRGQLADQPGLPHPRLTADEGERGLAVLDPVQQDGERRVLAVNGVQRIVTIAQDDILPTGDHDPRIAGLGKASGRSLEILSTAALLSREDAA